uniref:Uncharacterized protein n=1 Tax=Avena sativa TaxID=4498 RepID=A0ACD5YPZ7_AVESA
MAWLDNLLLSLLLLATFSPTTILCFLNPGRARVHEGTMKTSAYRSYIVLVEPPPSTVGKDGYRRWHESFLPSSHASNLGEPRLIHSYTEAFSGFAARLADGELDAVAKKPGFIRAFPDRKLQLMTTRTPEFLGLRNGSGFWRDAGYGKGIIVGLLDTGIHAPHPSFDDHGIPAPPAKWKGSCKAARCNNKLIGAQSLVEDGLDDEDGHGTHTSSTAAGNFVHGASYHGMGAGTAAGIAVGAHIAMYKVCTPDGCFESSVLAGIDAAIKDGVDVLSISLGGFRPVSFDKDPIAIGTFHAVSKGITVVCAGGNDGPASGSVSNDAPWLITVAAGSLDRSFSASIHLDNGKRIDGEALTQVPKSSSNLYPLHYEDRREDCNYFYDDPSDVAGKIVVCKNMSPKVEVSDILRVMDAGAAGVVVFDDEIRGYSTAVKDYNSSVVQVTAADGKALKTWASTSTRAKFTYHNTLLGVHPAPVVAWFSSRGDSRNTVGVLKPDILAPGLNVLAAWPPKPESGHGPFNILSGTSMATPHVSGVAALVKGLHPDWSPAAIKSAILTTADAINSTGGSILNELHEKASFFDMGSGHVNPARAADPGLVYELGFDDYAGYICSLYGDYGLLIIVHNSSLTCEKLPKVKGINLNYPTIMVPLGPPPATFVVNRTVTNVGPAASMYTAKVEVPKSLKIKVTPDKLVFSKAGEKKTFSVSVSGRLDRGDRLEGSLSWVSGKHVVRSPIIASTLLNH